MKINKIIACAGILMLASTLQSCKKFYDVNESPNNITVAPIDQLLPSITVGIGYIGSSDLYRYSGLIMQQFTGNTTNLSETFKLYERYNINNSDVNNQWTSTYSGILADIEKLIPLAQQGGSPHYAGVAKLLKAYTFQITVDAWGDIPYSESGKFLDNSTPKFDKAENIYLDLIRLIDEGIADVSSPTSVLSPTKNTTIFQGDNWNTVKQQWIRFGNTLKLRIYLHYTAKDPAFASSKINALIGSGAQFMTSNTDNFIMKFSTEAGRRTPNVSIEGGQFRNAFFPNKTIVDMMNGKADPRRSSYFVPFPYNSSPATYKGGNATEAATVAYSRLNTFLKGAATLNTVVVNSDGTVTDNSITWSGDGPSRLLTFAEYNFIRAEAALNLGGAGDAQTFFQAGIKASMEDAGVEPNSITTYINANGTLSGTSAQKLEQIINEKYIANFGVVMEPWSDWRRTGYPNITPLPISVAVYDKIPRTLVYPQLERNSNPNVPARADMLGRVFWDTRQ